MTTSRTPHETEGQMVRFFVRVGRWVIVGLVVAIAGLAATLSSDSRIAPLGQYLLYAGTLGAILVFDFLVIATAVWSWKRSRFVAGFLASSFALMTTAMIAVAFFLEMPQVRDALFLAAIPVGLLAPLVQALQERHRRTEGKVP